MTLRSGRDSIKYLRAENTRAEADSAMMERIRLRSEES